MKEESNTIKEVAKAWGRTVDLAEQFGGFIAKYIDGPLEQGIGILKDKLMYMRWERQVRLMQRASEFLSKEGFTQPTQVIPLKFAIPLLEAASLEDDDYLQDQWAKLIVNSAIEASGVVLTRTYIDILERLSPMEAKILNVMYSIPSGVMYHRRIDTLHLPESARIYDENTQNRKEPAEEIMLALANLDRLGCISASMSLGGGQLFRMVSPTILGKKFVEACILPSERRS